MARVGDTMDITQAIEITNQRVLKQSSALRVLEKLPTTIEIDIPTSDGDVWIKAAGTDEILGAIDELHSLRWVYRGMNFHTNLVVMHFKHPDLEENKASIVIRPDDAALLILRGIRYAGN